MKIARQLLGMIGTLSLLAASGRCVGAAEKVGQLSDPKSWQIAGVESFDPQAVTRSLARDFDVLLASHPQAALAGLPQVMRERLLEGYRSVGFANATATVHLDEKRRHISIHVTEGRRYRAGLVQVVGVDDELAEQLRRDLTTEQLPETAVVPVFTDNGETLHWLDQNGDEVTLDKPLWVEGEPAAFNDSIREAISSRLTRALGASGYIEPKFTHELTRNDVAADLLVRIEDLGTAAVLREIEIVGNERNSRDEIIDYLKLRIGERFPNSETRRVALALRASARFVEHQAEAKSIDASGGTKLTIKLKELSVAPRLSEPLTREDLALLKVHHWLTQGEGRDLDNVIRVEAENSVFECVISPNSGFLASVRLHSEQATSAPIAHTVIASEQELSLYNLRDRRCLILPTGRASLDITLGLCIGDDAEKPFKFSFGAGISSVEKGKSKPPFEMKTTLEPAVFLGLGRLQNPVHSWDGDRLSVRTKRGELTVDSRTGRLIERSFASEEDGVTTIEFRAGAFDQAVAQLRESASDFQNEYDTNRPASSTLMYACSLLELFAAFKPEIAELERVSDPAVVAAARKLLDHGLLDVIDQELASSDETDDDDFSIPPSKPLGFSSEAFGRVAVAATDNLFPRDTWPSDLLRETGFFLAGHREHTAAELGQVVNSESFGPIGHWVLAELMSNVSPQMASSVARRGNEHMSNEAFQRDVSLLTANCREYLDAPVRAACSLSDEEVATLGRLVLDDPAELVRAVQLMRKGDEGDANAAMLLALGQLWSNDLQQRVSERLRQISMNRTPRVADERAKTVE